MFVANWMSFDSSLNVLFKVLWNGFDPAVRSTGKLLRNRWICQLAFRVISVNWKCCRSLQKRPIDPMFHWLGTFFYGPHGPFCWLDPKTLSMGFSTWKKKVQTLRNESAIFRTFWSVQLFRWAFLNKMSTLGSHWRQWSWDFTVSLNEYAIRCEIASKKINGSTYWLNITKNEQRLINDRSSHWLTGRVQWTKNPNISPNEKRWSVSNSWLSYWLSIFGKRISKQENQMWSTTL